MSTYNSMETIEAKRRLSEYVAELARTGAPHQQTLINDLNTLLHAHTLAVEQINKMTPLLGAASTDGNNLAQIRKMASAGEPLIDIHKQR